MNEGLPDGWCMALLGNISTHPQYGWTCSASKTGDLKLLRTTDISNGKVEWNKVPFCSKLPDREEKFLLKANDILVSRAGSVGISYRIKPDDLLNKSIFASYLIRFCPLTPASYVEHFLKSHHYWQFISNSQLGIAVPNVNASKLAELPIPLPPLNEQKRIAAKLDKIIPRIEAVKERMDKVAAIVKRFRQSVLTAAVAGRLTEKWREEQPDAIANSTLSDIPDNLKKSHLNVFEQTKSFDIPESWINVPIINIGNIVGGGTPSKSNFEFWKGPIPWISPKDMKINRISKGKDFISEEAIKKSSTKLIPQSSLIFVIRGMILAHSFPSALTLNELAINQDMKAIIPSENVNIEYIHIVFKQIERKVLSYIKEATHGTLRLEIPLFQTFAIPLPPLEEQKEIVRQVDQLFALADKLETRYQNAKAKVDRLTQSVLAKAFRGELVPQDPDDEPAEKLLARIRAEQSGQGRVGSRQGIREPAVKKGRKNG